MELARVGPAGGKFYTPRCNFRNRPWKSNVENDCKLILVSPKYPYDYNKMHTSAEILFIARLCAIRQPTADVTKRNERASRGEAVTMFLRARKVPLD